MYSAIDKLARAFALLGGAVLSAIIVLTCLSIIGRSINTILNSDFFQNQMPDIAASLLATGVGPINGDFELVEAGMAFAIFAFIPICQLHGAHASVDIFTSKLSPRINRFLRVITELVFALVLTLIAFQLLQGMLSKKNSGEVSFLLAFPVWWAYAFSLLAAVVSAFVAVYIAIARILETVNGSQFLPSELGADH